MAFNEPLRDIRQICCAAQVGRDVGPSLAMKAGTDRWDAMATEASIGRTDHPENLKIEMSTRSEL